MLAWAPGSSKCNIPVHEAGDGRKNVGFRIAGKVSADLLGSAAVRLGRTELTSLASLRLQGIRRGMYLVGHNARKNGRPAWIPRMAGRWNSKSGIVKRGSQGF